MRNPDLHLSVSELEFLISAVRAKMTTQGIANYDFILGAGLITRLNERLTLVEVEEELKERMDPNAGSSSDNEMPEAESEKLTPNKYIIDEEN